MPFTWKKKTRCTRFSQLVADHLQSPKRGGSLVLEPGFPTSLIDLYVRNRGRFRRSSAMRPRQNDSLTPSSSSASSSSPSSGLLVDSNSLSSGATGYRKSGEIIEEDAVVVAGIIESDNNTQIESSSKAEVETSVEMSNLNPVMVVALKVLLMVILALGTKRFTVGITVSAFVLLFLELVGKPLLIRSNSISPSVNSKPPLESSLNKTKNIEISKEKTTTIACSEVVEIEEVVESNQEIRPEKELDEARSEVLPEIRHKSSRGAIVKSRMKKLVPKKLRKSSMGSKGEISCGFKEEETVKCAQDLKPLVISNERSDSKGETLCILKQEKNKIVEIKGVDCENKELWSQSQQNTGDLVLCLLVLVGLIGGRFIALVLALSWCLMLKKLQWRNVKFPIT